MTEAPDNNSEIQFSVTTRPATSGRTEVVLRLYRGRQLASETVIADVPDNKARKIQLISRIELVSKGYDEHVETLPRVELTQFKKVEPLRATRPLLDRPSLNGRGTSFTEALSRLPLRSRDAAVSRFNLRGLSDAASSLRRSVRAMRDSE